MSARSVNGVSQVQGSPVDLLPSAQTALNLTAATSVSTAPCRLARINVIVAGTVPGAAYDSPAAGQDAAGNEVFVIPNTVGVYWIDWPCSNGLTVVPGTGQTVAVAWY